MSAYPGDDLRLPFQIEASGLRGRVIRLGPVVDTILSRHDYPLPVATLLGELIALAAALAGALKYDGVFTLQIKADGPVRLMLADVTSAGGLRGYAQFDADAVEAASHGRSGREGAVQRLLGAGHIAFTVDQGPNTQRYQGIVELQGATLADCMHHYFRQSEQLQTALSVSARPGDGGWRAGALMLQRLPPEGGAVDTLHREAVEEAWRRAVILMATGSPEELTDPSLSAATLLYRLFHEDGVRVWPSQALQVGCRCTGERSAAILGTFPRDELEDMMVDGRITMTCQFCNIDFVFDDDDLNRGAVPVADADADARNRRPR